MKRVFLSFSKRDRKIAAALERELKKLGISAFNSDDELKEGSDWRKEVNAAIRKSDMVVVVLGEPDEVAGGWIGYEVGSATALGKDVVVMKPSSYSVGDLPVDLAGWRTLDFDPARPDKAARTLVSSLAVAN